MLTTSVPRSRRRASPASGPLPPRIASWDEATALTRAAPAASFPKLTDPEWRQLATHGFREENGVLRPDFDPNLLRPLEALDLETGLPALWAQFDGLRGVPALAIRGALSSLLSAEALERMRVRHPRLRTVTVPDVGHAPRLSEPEAVDAIEDPIREAEAA